MAGATRSAYAGVMCTVSYLVGMVPAKAGQVPSAIAPVGTAPVGTAPAGNVPAETAGL